MFDRGISCDGKGAVPSTLCLVVGTAAGRILCSGVSAERRSHHYGNRSASLQRITSNEKGASGPSERGCLDTRFKDTELSFRTPVDSARVRRISKPDEPVGERRLSFS